jgi:hypothetical protein
MSSPVTIFLVRANADTTEGRGPMVPVCATLERPIADAYITTQWGGLGLHDVIELPLYSITNPPPTVRDEARARALSKLSPEERELLGLPR